ncbi:hypothetical protein TRIUR3_13123 [Triticum urartu]|uniref:Uncharacterized protein n=1 Tax=Triticum urartu TaxID=4572 RepID=M7ZV55_TRIUA|nr:hypothetical protein TRIUR3_13123 [Triticum urartu]
MAAMMEEEVPDQMGIDDQSAHQIGVGSKKMAMPPAEKVIVVDANPSKNGHGDKLDDLPVADETSHQIGVDTKKSLVPF